MCELISWCEKDGDVFYLTDKEADIMVNQENMDWNDVIGHHAIERFWKVPKPCKHYQFPVDANTDKMPDEILKALESGKFNRMMKETNQHLKHVGNNCWVYKGWRPDGTLEYEYNYKDGNLHGVQKAWRTDGTLIYEYNFKDGKKHGVQKAWWPGGTLRHEHNFKNGKFHGVYKAWCPDGTPEYEDKYKDGVRID